MKRLMSKNVPYLITGSSWWKKPLYYNPVVHPLNKGPDFSFWMVVSQQLLQQWSWKGGKNMLNIIIFKRVFCHLKWAMSSSGSSSQAGVEEKIILVLNPLNNETEEVVLSDDNTLDFSTLDHAFPGAYGLKFTHPISHRQQYVKFNKDKEVFLAPNSGWKGKTFNLVFYSNILNNSISDRHERREYLYKQIEKTPFSDEPDHLPSIEYMKTFLFHIKEENFNSWVTCVDPHFFATYLHHTHRKYKRGNSITVYSYDGTTVYDTVVCFIDEELDLILLNSSTKIMDVFPICEDYTRKGSRLKMIGKSSEDNTPCCVYGYLYKEEIIREPEEYGPFMVGKMDNISVEYGTAVFDMHGLYGVYIAMPETFGCYREQNHANSKHFEGLILPVKELEIYMTKYLYKKGRNQSFLLIRLKLCSPQSISATVTPNSDIALIPNTFASLK
ncbi:TDP43_N domain-containing protein [Meloidogyne graminicola]|uniref:TDP43_N domain-containing protein n=1 Tax=Meloidogyne graminicola TaxID=189291 RepID=A0A8S9ZKX4_9BILA|nr:TDP43_N domain-containing protein [Meloidogyne graminicola]